MSKSSNGGNASVAKAIGVMAVLLLACGGAFVFYGNTIVEWWIPTAIAVVCAAVLWLPMRGVWRWFWPSANNAVRFLAHIVLFTAVAGCALLAVNRIGADTAMQRTESAEVLRKYSEKHYRSRRVSKNRYVKGEEYYTWHVELQLSDGRKKTLSVSKQSYHRIASNKPMELTVADGMLGWPVLLR